MIDFKTTKPGDKLRIVGAGAPGFAKLGDVVTVIGCNGTDRCYVVNDAGEYARFALTCGAARLEPVTDESRECGARGGANLECARDAGHDGEHVFVVVDPDTRMNNEAREYQRGLREVETPVTNEETQ